MVSRCNQELTIGICSGCNKADLMAKRSFDKFRRYIFHAASILVFFRKVRNPK